MELASIYMHGMPVWELDVAIIEAFRDEFGILPDDYLEDDYEAFKILAERARHFGLTEDEWDIFHFAARIITDNLEAIAYDNGIYAGSEPESGYYVWRKATDN